MTWKGYNDLAWTERIIAPPEEYEEEVRGYIDAIKKHTTLDCKTMLHFGSGAGGHDFHFKKHFDVTGVDISDGMLEIAKERNPEVTYIKGDMRTIALGEKFDVVMIPDSIMYMTTEEEAEQAVQNAAKHCKRNGVILIVTHPKESFHENNFAYNGAKDNVHITIFENNYITSDKTYEAAMVFLIRENGKLSIHQDVHTLGLFSYETWQDFFKKQKLNVHEMDMNDLYDEWLLDYGKYKLKAFILTF
ncbi:class I SAM-dependent methyltransferase [Bacillus shivajii]|uniref:class I SAM-dependent methyltransferase n=1 Tax=Bacillus shivajii TaxID=1983719 RepID=UPI001CF9BB11|nr:class I SAM-dependent methyltransferase [Bacillus shivajii]UCZ53437.1 class I SAM-dependent methyltransferase [Bacillus shivajii]